MILSHATTQFSRRPDPVGKRLDAATLLDAGQGEDLIGNAPVDVVDDFRAKLRRRSESRPEAGQLFDTRQTMRDQERRVAKRPAAA